MTRFKALETSALELETEGELAGMYTLSPYVWRDDDRYQVLLRGVNHADNPREKVSRVFYGHSTDGLRFAMNEREVISPGPGANDKDGCEDPTVVIVDGLTYVYYSGWNQTSEKGKLLLCAGPDSLHLQKRGVALDWERDRANPKEASVAHLADGTWRLFFEYANDGASKIGLAYAQTVEGPWTVGDPPFTARSDKWDSHHLSPGPVFTLPSGHILMFYNGANKDVQWRIGCIVLDEHCMQVLEHGDGPLITPLPPGPGETDIAFVSSATLTGHEIFLYYSVADKDLFRTRVAWTTD